MLEEIEQGRLRPVQVFQDEDERTLRREPLEELAVCPERNFDRAQLVRVRNLGRLLGKVAEHLPERPEGDSLAVGEAASPEDACPLAQGGGELVRQARLADPG